MPRSWMPNAVQRSDEKVDELQKVTATEQTNARTINKKNRLRHESPTLRQYKEIPDIPIE